MTSTLKRIIFRWWLVGAGVIAFSQGMAQMPSVEFVSSDAALQQAFCRAKEMAMSYRGNPNDPVGPWYEAALPSRNAFCVRDVAHQIIAAEVLGMHQENKNMLTHFVSNISESKDWCTYWEMNRWGKPAPEDYRNDTAFWYNLNANFEIIYAAWRLYKWTGDTSYIFNPAFRQFFDISVRSYMDRWILQADSLLKRPTFPNAPVPFNISDYFHRCRGLPSYYEAIGNMMMSADLVAAIFRALKCYSDIAGLQGDQQTATIYSQKAEEYRKHLEQYWWDNEAEMYHTYFTNAGLFGKGEGETFLLWYDALTDSGRIRKTISHLTNVAWNVENMSYLPYQLYRFGYGKEAHRYILYLTDTATKRREYPEVSFGVMEGIVQGLMGVEADAVEHRITTLYNLPNAESEIRHLPVLGGKIELRHTAHSSTLHSNINRPVIWRAAFRGRHSLITVSGRKMKAIQQMDTLGNWKSFVDVRVLPGTQVKALVQ